MKKIKVILTILISFLISHFTLADNSILKKTLETLCAISTIEYQSVFYNYNKTIGSTKIDTALCYFDFSHEDSLLGPKFQFKTKLYESVFNGKMKLSIDYAKEQIVYYDKPVKYDVSNSIFSMFSIYELKKLLPYFLNDTSTTITQKKDTIINRILNYSFEITVKDKFKRFDIDFVAKKGYISKYKIFISKQTLLPTRFLNVKANMSNSYSKYNFFPVKDSSSWNIDSYPPKYLRISNEDYNKSIESKVNVQIGKNAPDFSLQTVDQPESINIDSLKRNLVLLEFFFPYCTGCVKAIPHITEINNNYSKKGLKIFGIEFTNTELDYLKKYISQNKIHHPVLHSGKEIAVKYGVQAAPTFFLIDKTGKIVYASVGLNKSELIKYINKYID